VARLFLLPHLFYIFLITNFTVLLKELQENSLERNFEREKSINKYFNQIIKILLLKKIYEKEAQADIHELQLLVNYCTYVTRT
jgi:hypothetical protein